MGFDTIEINLVWYIYGLTQEIFALVLIEKIKVQIFKRDKFSPWAVINLYKQRREFSIAEKFYKTKNQSSEFTMAAIQAFQYVLSEVQTSGLNFRIELSPFSATISAIFRQGPSGPGPRAPHIRGPPTFQSLSIFLVFLLHCKL